MADLSNKEMREVETTYGIYAFESEDGILDGFYLVEALRALGLVPSLAIVYELGGTENKEEKKITLDEFAQIYSDCRKRTANPPDLAEYLEILKLWEGKKPGKMPKSELLYILQNMGERLTPDETALIIKDCCPPEDSNGNVRYEKFVTRILRGPRLIEEKEEEKETEEKADA